MPTNSTAVKRIHESMRGAPQLKGAAGTGVALLDAFLVDGWGLVTASGAGISAGVCTITVGVGNDFEAGAVILVAGATPAGLNGEHRVQSADATTITFNTDETGPVSGTITVKYASCGWETIYTGTNKRVYRSRDIGGARRYLRVNDTSATYMRVYGYNSMSALETGSGNFGNALYWHKADSAGSTPMRYDCFGDSMAFLYAPAPYFASGGGADNYTAALPMFFGEQVSDAASGDAWATLITGSTDPYWGMDYGAIGFTVGATGIYVERAAGGSGGAVNVYIVADGAGTVTSGAVVNDRGFGSFPSALDGKLRLARAHTTTTTTNYAARGRLPGVYWALHDNLASYGGLVARDTVPGPDALSSRRLAWLPVGSMGKAGGIFIDQEGPWR